MQDNVKFKIDRIKELRQEMSLLVQARTAARLASADIERRRCGCVRVPRMHQREADSRPLWGGPGNGTVVLDEPKWERAYACSA